MPTSSQALILIRTDSGKLSSYYKTRFIGAIMPLHVSGITVPGAGEYASKAVGLPVTKVTIRQRKHVQDAIINGYRGALSYDAATNSFRWQLLPGMHANQGTMQSPENADSEEDVVRQTIVLTDIDNSNSDREKYDLYVNSCYRRLLDLGFSTSSLKSIDDKQSLGRRITTSPTRSLSSPNHNRQTHRFNTLVDYASAPNLGTTPCLPSTDGLGTRGCEKTLSSGSGRTTHPRRFLSRRIPSRGNTLSKLVDYASAPNIGTTSCLTDGRETGSISQGQLPSGREKGREKTLLQEESTTEINSKRKRLKLPHIRMRSHLPPPTPHSLCFSLNKKTNFSHNEIKNIVESQVNTSIRSLKFDPVFVHLGIENTDGVCLWVFSLEDESLCTKLLTDGLIFMSKHVRVRRYDDVLQDEHRAYRLYRSVTDDQERRHLLLKRRASRHHPRAIGANKHIAFTSRL